LSSHTTGGNNTAVGTTALAATTTAEGVTAVGFQALQANTTGTRNVAVGKESLKTVTTGIQNTAMGNNALELNTANNNTAFGYAALNATTTGGDNTAVGVNALKANTTGIENVAMGVNSLDANTTGDFNTAFGTSALGANTTADNNTAVGTNALVANTTGGNNVAAGQEAGKAITTGAGNTCIGQETGDNITTGSGNTVVGRNNTTAAVGTNNSIVLGVGVAGTASSRITIGDASAIAELDLNGSDTSWAASSDRRLKENINNSEAGLSFINDLQVRTFDWKKKKDLDPALVNYYEDSDDRIHGVEGHTYHGFIAQEVLEVLENHDEVRNGLGLIKNREDGVLSAAPSALVPVLTKAVQELSTMVDELKQELKTLKGE